MEPIDRPEGHEHDMPPDWKLDLREVADQMEWRHDPERSVILAWCADQGIPAEHTVAMKVWVGARCAHTLQIDSESSHGGEVVLREYLHPLASSWPLRRSEVFGESG